MLFYGFSELSGNVSPRREIPNRGVPQPTKEQEQQHGSFTGPSGQMIAFLLTSAQESTGHCRAEPGSGSVKEGHKRAQLLSDPV